MGIDNPDRPALLILILHYDFVDRSCSLFHPLSVFRFLRRGVILNGAVLQAQ
jgi:hypothetical protein